MGIDINKLKSRLSNLQNPKNSGKADLPKTLWSPTAGKHSIRIVPSMYDRTNPFKEVFIHYGVGKTMIALTNFGEKDPIVDYAQGLRKTADWKLAKDLEPRMRVYVPVIIRGEEDKGVLLWGFGKTIYMELLSLLEDEDIGDYTDPLQGRDITIETLGKETTGKDFNTSTVRVRTKITPLSDDPEKIKLWMNNQPNPLEQFKKFTYDEMKAVLWNHLNPDEEVAPPVQVPSVSVQASSEAPFEEDSPNKATAYSLSTSKPKLDSRIDELFDF